MAHDSVVSEKRVSWLRSAFSESDGTMSFARLQTFCHLVVSSLLVIHGSWGTYKVPDATTFAALSAFNIAPYAANKIPTMFGKDQG